MVPWRLDSAGKPPNVEVVAEVEAALGTVLGAETPAEGFRRLEAGVVIARGSWADTGRVQHRVHPTEEARAEAEEGDATAAMPEQVGKGMRSGCSRLAGVEQPEGGDNRATRSMYHREEELIKMFFVTVRS